MLAGAPSIRVGADTDLEATKAGDAAEARADVHDLDGLQHVRELHGGGRELLDRVGEGLVEG